MKSKLSMGSGAPEEFLDQLADALHEMVQLTCPTMEPLWLEHSRRARESLLEESAPPPPGLPAVSLMKSARSKYRSLAGWRHCVVWQNLHKVLPGTDRKHAGCQAAMVRSYFRPYPADAPPYSWSQRTSEILEADEPVAQFRKLVALGCRDAIARLRDLREAPNEGPDGEFIDLGLAGNLMDVLKLDQYLHAEERGLVSDRLVRRSGRRRGGGS